MLPASVDRRQLGEAAESAALAFLRDAGLVLVARNVSYPFGEIDLVMRDGNTLCFIEVRYRRNARFGGAAVSIDGNKRRKIARASQAWLSSHRQDAGSACRFDAVAVSPDGADMSCEWIRSAFTMDDLW